MMVASGSIHAAAGGAPAQPHILPEGIDRRCALFGSEDQRTVDGLQESRAVAAGGALRSGTNVSLIIRPTDAGGVLPVIAQ